MWRRRGGRRRLGTQLPAPDPEVVALRQRLETVEAYAQQVTAEVNLLRAQVAELSARPTAPAADQPQPLDLPRPVVVPEPDDLPEYAAVVRQIELPETPPIWAGPPAVWTGPAEQPSLSLDIPLVATDDPEAVHAAVAPSWRDDMFSMAAPRSAPLIDVVPTVTRRAS